MIGKIVIGKSFGGCVRYVMGKQDAEVLYGEGIRMDNASTMTLDFNVQRKVNPELTKAVAHISLNWSDADAPNLDSTKMLEMAREYMELMGIRNTQFLIVRHHDNHHPHLHLIYNRIDNDGRTIPDQFLFNKNVSACKVMNLKHGLFIAKDRNKVNRKALKGADQIKYQLYDRIRIAKACSKNWNTFQQRLSKSGIEVVMKYRNGTTEIQGISFRNGEYSFKGSEIDRSLSFGKLDSYFEKLRLGTGTGIGQFSNEENTGAYFTQSNSPTAYYSNGGIMDILLDEPFPEIAPDQEDPRKKKKGVNKREGHGRGR